MRTVPKSLTVLSSGDVAPLTLAVTTHHVQADTAATCTAPHEYFSQTGTPSTVCAKAFVKTLSLEAKPTSSFGLGIFAKEFPSLLFIKPIGGHTGDGEGVIFALAFAREVVESAPATGMHTDSARSSAISFLITIPLELSVAKEDSNY